MIKKIVIIVVCLAFISVGINDVFASGDKKDDEKQQISLKQTSKKDKEPSKEDHKIDPKNRPVEDYIDGIGDFSLLNPAK